MAAELECGVCLMLPEGEVHQCNEGHCYCVACWRTLDPRRCPECRQPIQDSCRSRAAERAIAALEAICDHCAEATTRGAMSLHLRACPQRPTACAGAEAGCGWSGVAAEQAAHEAACPIAVCQRMMPPLQAQNQQLQSENQELRARVGALEPLQAQNQQLQSENQELRARVAALQPQVAALQPLAGRVRALEGDAEVGGRRQRQRVGAAPHDAPPSSAAVRQMGLAAAVAALQAHVAVARVAEGACFRVADLCLVEGNRQPAVEAGALEAVVAAMWAHPQLRVVQQNSGAALNNMLGRPACSGPGLQRAVEAGVLQAVVAAMQAHPQARAACRLQGSFHNMPRHRRRGAGSQAARGGGRRTRGCRRRHAGAPRRR